MRYQSIDFYRGLTMAFMIIVNTPGDWNFVYGPLLHASWHGCTPTDVVFPSFLFIIGVSMWFSFEKYGRLPNLAALTKVGKRTAILWGLGLLLAWYPFYDKNIGDLRILGVLARLGLCYGLASLAVLYLSNRALAAAAAGVLLGYWAVLWWGADPGVDPYGLEGNAARRLDLLILGAEHLYKGKGIPFDPEGILSTFPATVNVLIGWWSGRIMQRYSLDKMRVVGELLLWGNILALNGVLWDMGFPINKSLWTSSFVLYTGGLSMILLAFSVWFIDVKERRRGVEFFLVFGANSLFAYLLAGFLIKTLSHIKWQEGGEMVSAAGWVVHTLFKTIDPGKFGSLLFALSYMLLIWAVCYALYRRKVFIKV